MPSAIIEANKRTRVRKKGGDVMRATKVDEPDEENTQENKKDFSVFIKAALKEFIAEKEHKS